MALEKLSSHAFCANCNFNPDTGDDWENAIIPNWVVNQLKLSKAELTDIAEINAGMYAPGYKGVVKFPKEEAESDKNKAPVLRRIRWTKPSRLKTANIRKRTAYQAAVNDNPMISVASNF
jgi:hypothetical protein